jgi:hypothetical protein
MQQAKALLIHKGGGAVLEAVLLHYNARGRWPLKTAFIVALPL